MLCVTGLVVDWSHWETKAVPGRKGLLFISIPQVRQKLMTKFTFLWCCPSCKYWWAGVNMNFKHTWHRWLLPLNVKWPLANNSWHSIKESLWQAAFLLYIFVIPEWSYSSGLRWNCSGELLPETQCSCRSVTKINCMMNVVCEPEYLGESTGIGDGGGQDAAGRRCPVVHDSAASASLLLCLSQALVMLNHCTGGLFLVLWVTSFCQQTNTDTAWMEKEISEWCYVFLFQQSTCGFFQEHWSEIKLRLHSKVFNGTAFFLQRSCSVSPGKQT